VFETSIVRILGHPNRVWCLVARRLRQQGINVPGDVAFMQMREHAELVARDWSGLEDVDLAAVYGVLGNWMRWSSVDAAGAVGTEIDQEIAVARANPRVRIMTEPQPRRLGYVSDTVLPEHALSAALQRCGLPTGKVWSSGQRTVRKLSGNLFVIVADEVGVDVSDILHVGNDLAVDGLGAARAGAAFELVPEANLNRYESCLDADKLLADGLLGSALAGASRRCRLENAAGAPDGVLRVAAGVAGPTLVCATLWALLSAESAGQERLYFVSRDGELPLQIAGVLQAHLGVAPGVECRYLYGSRRSWRAAAEDENPADDAGPLRTLLDYLAQEKVIGSTGTVGVVDVGWLGTAAASLDAAIAGSGKPPVRWYLLGGLLSEGSTPPPDIDQVSYLLQNRDDTAVDHRDLVHLMEAFCGGAEGSTAGFRRSNGRVEPVLVSPVDAPLAGWGLKAFQATVVRFAELLSETLAAIEEAPALEPVENMRPMLRANIRTLWHRPEADEARDWSAYPFDNPPSSPANQLAKLPSMTTLLSSIHRPRQLRQKLSVGPWEQARRHLVTEVAGVPARADFDRTTFRLWLFIWRARAWKVVRGLCEHLPSRDRC
jgi:hypothetical protein